MAVNLSGWHLRPKYIFLILKDSVTIHILKKKKKKRVENRKIFGEIFLRPH